MRRWRTPRVVPDLEAPPRNAYFRVASRVRADELKPSEALEKARKPFLIFLGIVGVWDLAGVSVKSATLSFLQVSVERPLAIEYALWGLFLYTFVVYLTAWRNEAAGFSWTRITRGTFFGLIACYTLEEILQERGYTRNNLPMDPSYQLVMQNDSESVIRADWADAAGRPILEAVQGYDVAKGTFTYRHTEYDHRYYSRMVRLPAEPRFTYVFIGFTLPLAAAVVVIAAKCGALLVSALVA